MRLRHGALLVEALCALALAGVLAAAAALALRHARRALQTVDGVLAGDRAGREAVAVAAALLRDVEEVVLAGDTAVAFPLRIGEGVVCAVESSRVIWLPPPRRSTGVAFTVRAQPFEPGDLVSLLVVDSLAVGARWIGPFVVDSVAERAAPPGCDAALGWSSGPAATAPRARLTLVDTFDTGVRAGTPVRLARNGRLALYRSGAEWMLGLRRCGADPMSCGAIQPVAGPLRTPGGGGFRVFRAVDSSLALSARGLPPAAETRRVVPRDAWP